MLPIEWHSKSAAPYALRQHALHRTPRRCDSSVTVATKAQAAARVFRFARLS